jgi:hypothetical protein
LDKREEITALWRAAATGTIQEVVAAGHKLLGSSVLLGDQILGVAAAECPVGQPEWSWEDYIQAGYAPDFKLTEEPSAEHRVVLSHNCTGWRGRSVLLGWEYILLDLPTPKSGSYHLVVCGDGSDPLEEQMEGIDELCQALLAVIRRGQVITPRVSVQQFLGWLLAGDLKEERMLEVRANLMDFPTEGFFHLLTVDIASYRPTERSVSAISAQLEELLGGTSTIYGQHLVILEHSSRESQREDPERLEELEGVLRNFGLTAGRSRIFYTLRDVPLAYRQTEELLRLSYCRSGAHLMDFSQMNSYLLVAQLGPEEQRESSAHPIVRRLAELDRESKFGYVETLKAYLQSGQRAAIACKRLHIHRNTLDYRLRKMEEQADIDWTDGELLFQLYFSVCLLEVLGRSDRKNLAYGAE